ncbi:hybrid sensor histidine kinase/response regulator transcription factor [Pedobacter zeae]|uniref:histidine kinase n=1 Tax=Pedobacter zeae TaxID=1737356 RepID=A0A7W6K8N9_9SPHI|nr:hybrid sensor histidine kinase/response regulator transcription factor [Pedobacter zeae]MBB4107231.1 ligand-binding sensor domain-containing protein/signal transduction histidine kinase/AraC-like DNA-binding protein [Pedobacter zeae]GGH06527.1 hybrid sensor histidine kinase/response regulator [Pedobacter zeae]
MENGLSQNSVMAIAQDKNQFVWMGTRHGLNRYDGYRFKIYNSSSDSPSSISDNVITSLLSDSKGRLWIGTENGLNIYNEKTDRFLRINKKSSAKSFSCDSVECLYEDQQKNIWIGTYNGLNLVLNAEKQLFKKFLFDRTEHRTGVNIIFSIFKDDQQNLWVGTFNGLVRIYQEKGKYRFEIFRHKANDPKSISSNAVKSIVIDNQKRLWLGTYNGLNLFDYKHKTFTRYQTSVTDPNSIVNNDIRKLMCDRAGNIWIGTQEGLSILDPNKLKFSNYRYDPEQNSGLSQNSIHSIFQDLNGSMYVGTFYKGVNVVYPSATPFTVYRNSKKQQGLSSNIVSAMAEDKLHNLWIGTEGGGLNYINRSTHTFTYYKSEPSNPNGLNSNLIKTLCLDKNDQLLVGTHRGGLYVFNPAAHTFRKITNVKDVKNTPGGAEVIAITEDSNGTVWVGSRDGLSTLSKTNGVYASSTVKSVLEKNLRNKYIQVIFEDQAKNLWIGTRAGLYEYNPAAKRITAYYQDKTNTKGLKSEYINCIMQLKNGNICIGTALGGLSIFDKQSKRFKNYNEEDGLPNSNVFGIIEDEEKNLWISTDKGLSKLVTSTGKFINYTKSDGLAGNNFNIGSFLKDSHGELFFGGYDGLTAFYPKQIDINKNVSPITFTGLKLFNQPVEVNGGNAILKEDIKDIHQITFKHDENDFTIDFALLNYIKPEKNSYSYILKGHSKDWVKTDIPSASYADLPSGDYTFIVKGNNNDGNPSDKAASLKITILPPFWATWWAYFIYLAFFSGLLFLIVRYLFVRALLKRTEDMQKMKLNFFTYVAHEIRTPLTLILGPLENLSSQYQTDTELNRQIIPIKNNANRLMRLITELMDFRKAETGHLNLHVTEDNIIAFINEIFISFAHLAQANDIQYEFIHEQENINLFFDKRQLEKVMFNLLSNAFKFCGKGGEISVSVLESSDEVTISISDNGTGIPAESLKGLFRDYFQVDEQQSQIGTGIGLALSKAIVEEHQGSIAVESTPAENGSRGFTKFTVKLKKGKSHFKTAVFDGIKDYPAQPGLYTQYAEEENTAINPEKEIDPAAKTVLVVEDNPEIRSLISSVLGGHYQIVQMENGLLGWETAIETLPDLIICDIMMPVMDGIELCKRLKEDERTSHIPVIILTARSSHIHQVSGLETGADAYITKPFSPQLLLLNARNLLMSREIMRQKFLKHIHLQPKELTINAVDEAFMQKLLGYIDQHLADEDFGVSELASMIGMSKPVLYKKIRQLTNLSVNDFVKSIRLKKAMELFKQNRFTIYEVAYQVGFNDPKYFSREFKKQFGKGPKAFMNAEE